MTKKTAILPIAYFPNIEYMRDFIKHNVLLETNENFVKKTIRNRCNILSPNGIITLSVPVKKINKKQKTKDVVISYAEDWQKKHRKAIETAYGLSPFFEYYIDDLDFVFNTRFEKLLDLNIAILNTIIKIIDINKNYKYTTEYIPKYDNNFIDLREAYKKTDSSKFAKYTQTFSDKFEFVPNLSFLDLLFNLGPETEEYLLNLK